MDTISTFFSKNLIFSQFLLAYKLETNLVTTFIFYHDTEQKVIKNIIFYAKFFNFFTN